MACYISHTIWRAMYLTQCGVLYISHNMACYVSHTRWCAIYLIQYGVLNISHNYVMLYKIPLTHCGEDQVLTVRTYEDELEIW